MARLLLLARSADRGLAPGASYSIDFVDEDDGRCVLARFREQVPDACGTDSNDHFDELGTAHRKEGHFGLAGDGPCQESLPCSRRTDQQHAFRRCSANTGVFLRTLEEVDDFHQLVLRLGDPSDVRTRRSEERSVGKEWVSTGRYRWWPYTKITKSK